MVCFNEKKTHKNPEHCIVSRLAPIIVGIKPGVLLRLLNKCNNKHTGCSFDFWRNNHERILNSCKLQAINLKCGHHATLVLFYSESLLANHLGDPTNAKFLKTYGYKNPTSVPSALKHLINRFNHIGCPPEIGIFLGYPLKDVIGYIKRKNKNHVPNAKWCVYGSIKPSVKLMNLHNKAELMFANMLNSKRNPHDYTSDLKMHFVNKARNIPHTTRCECPRPCLGDKTHCPYCVADQKVKTA